jgi:acyl-CoA synthetase (AMP-forming)/AMP-acid ligase II
VDAPRATADDPAAIIYTSGSTGAPRGATLSHRNLLTNTWSILEYLRLRPSDRMLVVLPFYYVYGMSLLNTHVAVGASLIVGTELFFPNKVIDRMQADGATGFAGVPSSFNVLLHRSRLRDDIPTTLRYVTQAGGAMAPELTRELIEAVPGVEIVVMYGATEASARLAYLPPDRLAEKIGSIGRAIPGVTLRVLRDDGSEAGVDEPGELVAQGENIMLGYWNAREETEAVLGAEGLRTGDLARRDSDGFLYIVGRKKEMIKSGAHRISPKEIEEQLVEHTDVLEAAVVGVPDDLLGEAIVAFVVLHESGTSPPDERAIQRFLLDRIAEYKVPRRILILDSLPKNESGKVQKRDLRSALETDR